eukprot:gnl/TRDRNA2_/TRDRNA2_173359_c2_seq5.p1 gnl/TRDRNA2_/TRDRNA2_173359_c2~~gnl/TRDRNA2_/TRDRNA2_173359_c2_seq5.p1  ORF type:complete len:187 (-),score=21.50 gnl/TRDRNA2_/TRDRNA2_173359_c2_seq5:246-806(-)
MVVWQWEQLTERRKLVTVAMPEHSYHLRGAVTVIVSMGGSESRMRRWFEVFYRHLDLCVLVHEILVDWWAASDAQEALYRVAPRMALLGGRLRLLRGRRGVGSRFLVGEDISTPYAIFLSDDTGLDCPSLLRLAAAARQLPGRLVGPWNEGRALLARHYSSSSAACLCPLDARLAGAYARRCSQLR